ncbi:MAG: putative protein tyrosine phosphatase [Halioglobus sp.]|jgi:predicted protein tyrosine phosphatase
MEQKHKNRLKAQFATILNHRQSHVLYIPDEYQYMDTELIRELEAEVAGFIGR